ncbi:hypothetical protein Bbelb_048710 [Branchiostoma belcheri]|nr:hypothetical protein Bbelb_048710 [Branchiostoma belcheri]
MAVCPMQKCPPAEIGRNVNISGKVYDWKLLRDDDILQQYTVEVNSRSGNVWWTLARRSASRRSVSMVMSHGPSCTADPHALRQSSLGQLCRHRVGSAKHNLLHNRLSDPHLSSHHLSAIRSTGMNDAGHSGSKLNPQTWTGLPRP